MVAYVPEHMCALGGQKSTMLVFDTEPLTNLELSIRLGWPAGEPRVGCPPALVISRGSMPNFLM